MLCYVMLCYVMLCYVMLCYVMLCYVMLCYVDSKVMGNSIDCCYTTRQYNQCFFPCIRTCSYTNRRVWYNYDGLESVQPLIDIIKPERGLIRKFPRTLVDISKDHEIANALSSGTKTQK